jgi:phosphatidylethanolamine-binding protein (PEBP) family uncharacterized protein
MTTCRHRRRESGQPVGTKSFALVVDDPDGPDPKAPKMTWVHGSFTT